MDFIPYGRQSINDADINAVVDVLKSDFLTQGSAVPAFERAVSDYVGSNSAVACNSATSALHVACLALQLGVDDWLWTSPNTFVASANCAEYCGAKVDFVDIDPNTYNMCADKLAMKLKRAKIENCLPKIVVPVHFAGQSCDMEKIHALSKQYNFRIIEDASHAIGASYQGFPVGGCQYSDITVFSFHPVKIITTAEGGMALTNDEKLAQRMELYRSHGVTRNTDLMQYASDGAWDYHQITLGYNYRMTDIQASLGISQLKRLDKFVAQRNSLAEQYDQLLAPSVWITPKQGSALVSARHLYVVRLPEDMTSYKSKIFNYLRSNNIGVNVHYIPVHTQPYYRNKAINYGDLSVSEKYYQSAISIPLYPNLSHKELSFVVDCLNSAIETIVP